jgi:hypothetical protein
LIRLSFQETVLPCLLLTGLLVGCQTAQQREASETLPSALPASEPSPPETERQRVHGHQTQEQSSSAADSAGHEMDPLPARTEPRELVKAETVPAARQAAAEAGAAENESAELSAGRSAGTAAERPLVSARSERRSATGDGADQAAGETGGSDTMLEQSPDGTAIAQNSDQRFREAMRRFDQRLDRERFGTDGSGTPGAGGGAAGNGSAAGTGGIDGERDTGAVAGPGNPFEDNQEAPEPSAGSRGGIGERSARLPPPGMPDGSDDDIVARQLREAAENESDPELRERLWEEYRAYKNDQ